MNLREMIQVPGEWMRGNGPEAEIVISSRVRLARNVRGFHFITRMEEAERAACEAHIHKQIDEAGIAQPGSYFSLLDLDAMERKLLVERHLISKEHEDASHPRGVAVSSDESVSVMVNEEDHIRLQVLQSGFQLQDAWKLCSKIDDELEARLDYSFSPQLGYLTACPTNVGTGIRVSVMLHLPALVLTRHIEKVFQAVSKINLAVRGLYGEGTEASGHFYQISNQVTLGRSEPEIVTNVETVIPTIVRYEHEARQTLLSKDRKRLEDRVWRAFGMLKYAQLLPSDEAMMLLSFVRMGVHLGLLRDLTLRDVNELFIFTQPAHLQKLAGTPLEPQDRDMRRAAYVREKLGKLAM
ncbi:MAG TPA: protein arginine kinase [Planctomycetota bacterium]|nr:protein arginine kinase [Planctomycetota bacterium]